MVGCQTLGDESLQVPTFYSPYNEDDPEDFIPLASAICVATVYGAIHCIPWSFHFATLQEQWVWRISAILISSVPISYIPIAYLLPNKENESTWMKLTNIFWRLIFIISVLIYIVARRVLLVLPFVALRDLPPGAYIELDWISFLPHIQ